MLRRFVVVSLLAASVAFVARVERTRVSIRRIAAFVEHVHGRLYQLVRQHDTIHDRTLEITFLESSAEAYVLTFG